MPGYMNWKELYKEEFKAMTDEGFDTASALTPKDGKTPLPIPNATAEASGENEPDWELAYERLWALREEGVRPDYPYVEPVAFEDVETEQGTLPALAPLCETDYRERLSGAVNGRISGVILGKPVEMGMSREDVKRYLESVGEYPLNDYISEYSPALDLRLREDCVASTKGNVQYAQIDDDINYTLQAMRLVENKGLDFTTYDVGCNFLESIPYHWVWCASRQAYYAMVKMEPNGPDEEALAAIPWKLNPWRECIDGQIKSDLWGYLFPGDPFKAAALAYRDCSFSLTKNGVYGGMFVAGCVAAAMTETPTVDSILDAGLAVIPQRSRLYETVQWVRERYAYHKDYIAVCKEIEERFADMSFAGTLNNLAMVTLALVHGNLDHTKTITCAVSCGIDTDCNGGTAGSICGAAVGRCGIEDRWLTPLCDTVHTCVADIGRIGIDEMIDRIAAVREKVK